MVHWSQRFRDKAESQRLSFAEIARRSGVSKDSIDKYAQGGVDNPRGATLDKIAGVLGVTKEWLLFGSGNDSPQESNGLSMIPLYEFKPGMGGGGIILDENPTGYMPISREYLKSMRLDTAALMALECEGDSMSPTLHSGDQVLVNKADRNPARGGIFAIFDSNTLVVKRIEKIPASDPVMLRLISDNQHHSTYDVIADDTNIIGRVVWYARRI